MSEPPLIYAFHGVVLLHSATSIVLSGTHFSSLSSDKKQKNDRIFHNLVSTLCKLLVAFQVRLYKNHDPITENLPP